MQGDKNTRAWDVVLFPGDLMFQGAQEEFREPRQPELDALWNLFKTVSPPDGVDAQVEYLRPRLAACLAAGLKGEKEERSL